MTIIGSIFVALFSLWMFLKIDKGEIYNSTVNETKEEGGLNIGRLKELNAIYEKRSADFESIKNSREAIPDPSL